MIPYVLMTAGAFLIDNSDLTYRAVHLSSYPIHLGDKYIATFDPQQPDEKKEFKKNFNLPKEPRSVRLILTAKDVDSDWRNGAVLIHINDAPLCYLNDCKPFCNMKPEFEHYYGFKKTRIFVPEGFLHKGDNNISISVMLNPLWGYDDINIKSVKILYR